MTQSKSSSYKLTGFVSEERGSIAILAAFALGLAAAGAAMAADFGGLYLERRSAQGAADLAAIAAAADLNYADQAAAQTLAANGIDKITSLVVTKGRYDESAPVDNRFVPGVLPYNAVKIDLQKTGTLYFADILTDKTFTIGVSSVSQVSTKATFSIGAHFDDSDVTPLNNMLLNTLLGGLAGGTPTLLQGDYEALQDADFTLGDFLNALASELGLTEGTYNDVLNTAATFGDVLNAISAVTNAGGDSQASAAAQALLNSTNASTLGITLTSLIGLDSYGDLAIGETSDGLNSLFNALELINGAAVVANENQQFTLDLTGVVPGLLRLTLDVVFGDAPEQSPWVEVGDPEGTLYSAPARFRLIAEVGGTGILNGVRVRLPLFMDLASSRGELSEAQCPGNNPANAEATIATLPGAADLWVGDVSDASMQDFSGPPVVQQPASIVNTFAIKVTGSAYASAADTEEHDLTFDRSDVDNGVAKSAGTTDITDSVVQTLLSNLQLNVQILGLGLTPPALVKSVVTSVLAPVAPPIDEVVATLLEAMGIRVGGTEVRVHGIRCRGSVTVG